MILMNKLRSVFGVQYFWLIMALDTFSFGDMTISLNHTEVALLTGYAPQNILLMIKAPSIDLNISLRCKMAGGTTSYSTRKTLSLSFRTSLIIVTDETVDFVDGQVGPLNQLSMAGGASKLHTPSQLPQMFSVREGDTLIDHISLKIFNLMASFL